MTDTRQRETPTAISLGASRSLAFTGYAFNPEHPDITAEPCVGIDIRHLGCDGVRLLLENETARKLAPRRPKWKVMRADPLTLDPDILCGCGEVGRIRNGRWEPGSQ